MASSTVISPRSMRCRISAVLSGGCADSAGGVGGVGGVGVAGSLVDETLEAGMPSTSKTRLPETLFRRTVVPPLPTWVTLVLCPMLVVVAGKDERIFPLTLFNSALQCVSTGTSNLTDPETEPNWYGPAEIGDCKIRSPLTVDPSALGKFDSNNFTRPETVPSSRAPAR